MEERMSVSSFISSLKGGVFFLSRISDVETNLALSLRFSRRQWLPLIPIDLPPPLITPGCNSLERDIQKAREESVLQEIFFSKES